MKKLLFVLAVATFTACNSSSMETPVTSDSTIVDTTAVGVDSILVDSIKIVDTIKK
jgi:uncharacterized protein YcfL